MFNKRTRFIAFLINKTTLFQESAAYISLRFGIDIEHETYERSVYSFWEFIGLIGGIYEIIDVFFALFVSTYNNRMFLLEVINKKIKVLTHQTNDDSERLSLNRNRLMMEEENKQQVRHPISNVERTELRKRTSFVKEPVKEFTVTDSLIDYICCCSKSSK